MFPFILLFQLLFFFPLWTGRPWAMGIIFLRVCGKYLPRKTNLFGQKYLPFPEYAENQMHSGAAKRRVFLGYSLLQWNSYCARSNVTVMSNVTEVLGKCKFWVNIMPYLLWNRITALKKVENELFYKSVRFPPFQVSCILTCWKLKEIKDLCTGNI